MDDAPLALILPGSRRSEVTRLLPVFAGVVERLNSQRPDLRYVLPAAPNVADVILTEVENWSVQPLVLDPRGLPPELTALRKRSAFFAADVAVAASGTVSLELAAANTPMVIAYDMNWLSRQIIGRMLRVDTVTLVNLVAETRVIPEFIGNNCQPELISQAVLDVLKRPDDQTRAMAVTMDRLGRGGVPPGERAAMAVLDGLNQEVGQTN